MADEIIQSDEQIELPVDEWHVQAIAIGIYEGLGVKCGCAEMLACAHHLAGGVVDLFVPESWGPPEHPEQTWDEVLLSVTSRFLDEFTLEERERFARIKRPQWRWELLQQVLARIRAREVVRGKRGVGAMVNPQGDERQVLHQAQARLEARREVLRRERGDGAAREPTKIELPALDVYGLPYHAPKEVGSEPEPEKRPAPEGKASARSAVEPAQVAVQELEVSELEAAVLRLKGLRPSDLLRALPQYEGLRKSEQKVLGATWVLGDRTVNRARPRVECYLGKLAVVAQVSKRQARRAVKALIEKHWIMRAVKGHRKSDGTIYPSVYYPVTTLKQLGLTLTRELLEAVLRNLAKRGK